MVTVITGAKKTISWRIIDYMQSSDIILSILHAMGKYSEFHILFLIEKTEFKMNLAVCQRAWMEDTAKYAVSFITHIYIFKTSSSQLTWLKYQDVINVKLKCNH